MTERRREQGARPPGAGQAAGIACLLLIAACGGEVVVGPPAAVVGSYSLRQVNETALPAMISNDGASRVDITSGTLDLDNDSTWLGRTNFRITTPGGIALDTQIGSGRWSLSRDSIRFDSSGKLVGTIRGDTLYLIRRSDSEEIRYVYRR